GPRAHHLHSRDKPYTAAVGRPHQVVSKATLLRIVAGLDRASTARVVLDGEAVTPPGADLGMVFQSCTLFRGRRSSINVAFRLRERGVADARATPDRAGMVCPCRPLRFRAPLSKTTLRRDAAARRHRRRSRMIPNHAPR